MSRDEYIQALMQALDFLPQEQREGAAAFYMEMLDDRMEDGMEESQAVAAMAEPAVIAERLREEWKSRGGADAPENADAACAREDEAAEDAECADALESVLQEVQSVMADAARAVKGVKRQLQDAVQGEYSGWERKQLICDAAAIGDIRLRAYNMPICIEPCQGDKITLIYYTNEQNCYEASAEDGVLRLNALSRGGGATFRFSLFGFHWGSGQASTPTVQLLLPADALVGLSAETSNGSIKLSGLSALCDTVLGTTNARVAVENVRCKSLDMHTTNARLSLKEINARQFLRGATTNGRIEGARLSSGGSAELNTTNANIQAEILEAEKICLSATNGNITASLPGRKADWRIESGTSNGNNNLPRHQPGEKNLSVHTSNGHIQASFQAE